MRSGAVVVFLFSVSAAFPATDFTANGRQENRTVSEGTEKEATSVNATQEDYDEPTLEGDNTLGLEDNETCVRQDFEDNAAAVFYAPFAGTLEAAIIIFNSSIGRQSELNITQVEGLQLLNQTGVDCSEYSPLTLRGLSPGAILSLTGR